ncbi:hypothetical protein [Bosea sp. (in: a-proteobacteria)]|uniref:hypothetical protein n=1 Tax=Bosea sp. (in: a-proteobacteria) TaxID=1871050 RepID=UPI002632DAFC|nr:hypothetical protein [Bosea sp. (in: a-proteobacteria)]MCO5089874.1 hypothetical protein [Bosea sp. (in: a-proteobacteria)]
MAKSISRVPLAWETRPLTSIPDFSVITGLSSATAYNSAKSGALELVKLAGRTFIRTETLVAFLASAQPYQPNTRKTAAATEARRKAAADAWRV